MALFLSYTREDRDFVQKFARHLNKQNIENWFDNKLVYGENWRSTIRKKISQADGFIIFISEHFYSDLNGFIHQELHMAIDTMRRNNYEDWIFFILLDNSPIPKLWVSDHILTSDFHSMRTSENNLESIATKLGERFGGTGGDLPTVRFINDSQLELTFAIANKARNNNFHGVWDGKTYWDNQMTGEGELPPPEPEYFDDTLCTLDLKPLENTSITIPKNEYLIAATYINLWMDPDGRSNGYSRKTSNAVTIDLKTGREAILRCRRSQKKGGLFSSREAPTYLYIPEPIIIN